MKFHQNSASLFIPDAQPEKEALERITRLGIGAHQDDLEFMAFHGILSCYENPQEFFAGITCTNGAGSARGGAYASFSDTEMREIRHREQETAAVIGRYGAMIQLDYPSASLKRSISSLVSDLALVLEKTRPRVVYTHNLADKHDTHVAVGVAALLAIRSLPREHRPAEVYGCEVWRDLDWLNDEDKTLHDLSGHDALASMLNAVFDSQIAGGKRYDLAITGRRRANATFLHSHHIDDAREVSVAMNLTPLAHNDALDIGDYVVDFILKFEADVRAKILRSLSSEHKRPHSHLN